MARIDHAGVLDGLLADWHRHSSGYNPMKEPSESMMFRGSKSGRGWQETNEVNECESHGSTMETIDFQISEMRDPHRTAIHINARNCATGRKVWTSARLPTDPMQCARVVSEARAIISDRLTNAGVLD